MARRVASLLPPLLAPYICNVYSMMERWARIISDEQPLYTCVYVLSTASYPPTVLTPFKNRLGNASKND